MLIYAIPCPFPLNKVCSNEIVVNFSGLVVKNQAIISQVQLGGKMAPKLVYFVLEKELVSFCKRHLGLSVSGLCVNLRLIYCSNQKKKKKKSGVA